MQERNISLDYLRLILSFFIIAAHIQSPFGRIPWISWPIQDGFSHAAVPVFFIMNGFFLHPILSDKAKVKKYISRLVLLYVVWMIIYRPFYAGQSFSGLSSGLFDTLYVYLFGYVHLWYMAALIPIVVILYYFKKWNWLNNYLLAVLLVLYIVGFFYQRPYLLGLELRSSAEYTYMRNFLSPGLLFVFLGYYIRERKVMDKFRVGNKAIMAIVILCVLLIGETFITLTHFTPSDYYLVLPILCPLVFIVVYQKGKTGTNGKYIRDLSTAVYFLHALVIKLLDALGLFHYSAMYLMTVFLTLVLSAALIELNKKVNIFL